MSEIGDVWYRIQDVRYAAPVDEFGRSCGEGTSAVNLYEHYVTKVTPKGVWLDRHIWVRSDARKRYACPTLKEAYESFMARKRRQRSIIEYQLRRIEKVVRLAAIYADGTKPEKDQKIPSCNSF